MCEIADIAEGVRFRAFPGVESFRLGVPDGVPILLHRKRGAQGAPVLLLHGGSARHDTFKIPGSDGGAPRSLMDWLADEGYEPWLLDWRGSGLVLDVLGPEEVGARRTSFDLDRAASHDVPAALDFIRRRRSGGNGKGAPPIGAVGHCMGGAVLAQAIASGSATPERHGLTRVVLLTLGLFYEPPLDSRLKVEDHSLEHLFAEREVHAVDPREAFPPRVQRLYEKWPDALRPHPMQNRSRVEQMCARLGFMYGLIYLEQNLAEEIHGRDGEEAELPRQFGPMPLKMYIHIARNLRSGFAASYHSEREPGPLERKREAEAREHFDRLERVTLVTGDRNQLWHRDSIDRMYEWLTRGAQGPGRRDRYRKVIRRGYGHQDLLWGKHASRDVFPAIRAGLEISPRQYADDGGEGRLRPRRPLVHPHVKI